MTTHDLLAARRAALDLLDAVLVRKRPFDDALESHSALARLPARDRAFARLLSATVLRRRGEIDAVLDAMMTRGAPAKPAVLDILRLGAAQLLFLHTPAHAAVATAVALADMVGLRHFKGLINAVLRRIAREGAAVSEGDDPGRRNTPDWLWRSWEDAYGAPTASAIARAHLAEAPLDITVKGDAHVWAERLDARVLPFGDLRRAPGGVVTELPGFDEGAWWVQDAAASLPARLMGDVRGARVIDLCAAPGGKTAQLAAAGADVTAVDRSPRRLRRVEANLARLGLAARTVAADAAQWEPDAPADAVLLDAPCTATGTIRRHPDIPWLKTAADIAALAEVQRRMLAHAIGLVRPGGVLVYCTCSIQPEEGENQIDGLLAGGAPVERLPIDPAEVGGCADLINARGELRSLPCHLPDLGGLDGFFVARLRRVS